MRLNKYIASCGVCSRREADKLILEGRIQLNGQVPKMGADVDDRDIVLLDGRQIRPKAEHTYIAYYKPVGVVCTSRDPHAKRTVYTELGLKGGITYAGRLDKDSEGLLLLTDDGDLIEAMMKAKNAHEKEYLVTIDKEVDDAFIRSLSNGVYLKDLDRATRPCKVRKTGERSFDIILTQGLNRQIRRMCAELGADVLTLKRVRVLSVSLSDYDLKCGEYVYLPPEKVTELYRLTGLSQTKG